MDDKVRRLIDETNDRLRMLNKQEDDYPAWIVDYDFLERGLIQGNNGMVRKTRSKRRL